MYYLKIIGDGFLKYMIRYLMGALLDLARRRITLDEIALYLQQHQEHKLSPKAKAKGLHLIHIEGPE
jgi:tRNA pseudouridine38-40 synthase